MGKREGSCLGSFGCPKKKFLEGSSEMRSEKNREGAGLGDRVECLDCLVQQVM